MPERILGEAIEHFDEGVDEIAALVKEIRGLKRWRLILIGLILALGISISAVGYVLHRLEQDRVEGCRSRNESFARVSDFIEVFAGDNPEGLEFAAGLRVAAIADCDRDGDTADDLVARR